MLHRSISLLLVSLLVMACLPCGAQTIELLTGGTKTSIRGLSVVSDEVIWVSGSGGMVGRSVNGGKTWEWTTVPGFESREFRDIEAFDANTAVIIAIAEPANILRTTDGGKTWATVFTDTTKGMFLDAMDFYDRKHGIVIGDPIRDTVFLATTEDGGLTWEKYKGSPVIAKKGEAFFAASGSNILYRKGGSFHAVSGGTVSRMISDLHVYDLVHMTQGKETTGANSIATFRGSYVVVGGDFAADTSNVKNCFKAEVTDGATPSIKAIIPTTPPHGYRSCVEYITADRLICCGTSGVDISRDGSRTWELISQEGYHVCRKAKKGKAVFLAGGKGRIAKLNW